MTPEELGELQRQVASGEATWEILPVELSDDDKQFLAMRNKVFGSLAASYGAEAVQRDPYMREFDRLITQCLSIYRLPPVLVLRTSSVR